MSAGGSGLGVFSAAVLYDYGIDDKSSVSNKPPMFNCDPDTFFWWKTKMYGHIMVFDEELWDVLEDGVGDLELDEEGVDVDRKKHTTIKVTRKSKKLKLLYMLVQQYELFRMKEDEDIQAMYSRFQTIVFGLQILEKNYVASDHVKKILTSFPAKWRPKVTTIEEAKDLNTIFRNKKFCRDLFKKQNILQRPKTTKWVQSSCATYTSHHKNGVRDYFKKQKILQGPKTIFFYRDQNLNEPYLQGRVQYLSLNIMVILWSIYVIFM